MSRTVADLKPVEAAVAGLLDPLRHDQPPIPAHVTAEAIRRGSQLRYRRRPMLLAVPALAAGLIVALVLVIQAAVPSRQSEPATNGAVWHRAAASPLSVRTGAFMVTSGSTVFVFGGYAYQEPGGMAEDGAAYDLEHNTWRRIAPAPRSLTPGSAVATPDTIYVLRRQTADPVRQKDGYSIDACWRVGDGWNNPGCERQVMAYSIAKNRWTQLPTPPRGLDRLALTGDGRPIAYRQAQKPGAERDYQYDSASRTWLALPPDGLGVTTNRTIASTSSGLVVIAAEPADAHGYSAWTGAMLKTGATAWEHLPPSGAVLNTLASVGAGYPGPNIDVPSRWAYVGGVLVNPSAQTAGGRPTGGILDPRTRTWSALPTPSRPAAAGQPILRAAGDGRSVYGQQLFDVTTRSWRPIPAGARTFPNAGQSAAIFGDRLLVFGGSRLHKVEGGWEGPNLNDLWVLKLPSRS